MKRLYLLILFAVAFESAAAQVDSMKFRSIDSVAFHLNQLTGKISSKTDSLNPISKLQDTKVADTLTVLKSRIDSVEATMNSRIDSLQQKYEGALTTIQQSPNSLKSKIDSLVNRGLPVDKYTAKLDSVSQKAVGIRNDLEKGVESVKSKAKEKLNSIPLQPELKEKMAGVTQSIDKLGPQTIYDKLPLHLKSTQLNIGGLGGLPSVPGLSNLSSPLKSGVSQISDIDKKIPGEISKASDIGNLGSVTKSSEVKEITGKAGEISQMKSQSVDQIAESKFKESGQVQQIQKEAQIPNVGAIKSEAAMKAELKKQGTTAGVDHFAGKEQQLKAAMERIAKYKQKYSTVKSIDEISKRPPNAMRGKPLIERIVPGLNLQFQGRGQEFMVDFNPYAGYRFTGRITAGLGWNQRVSYNHHTKSFVNSSSIYGPRAFGEFRLGKGFCPRIEGEVMNTLVPPITVTGSGDPYARKMVLGIFTGIKKEYKFIGRIRGTASVMARVYNPKRQSPYGDVINARIGFEFPMKRDKRKVKK